MPFFTLIYSISILAQEAIATLYALTAYSWP